MSKKKVTSKTKQLTTCKYETKNQYDICIDNRSGWEKHRSGPAIWTLWSIHRKKKSELSTNTPSLSPDNNWKITVTHLLFLVGHVHN